MRTAVAAVAPEQPGKCPLQFRGQRAVRDRPQDDSNREATDPAALHRILTAFVALHPTERLHLREAAWTGVRR
jgi:hypothetical protein